MTHDVAHWWTHEPSLRRYVRDVLQTEMAQLRPGGWPLPPAGWHDGLHWQDDLGADSLERLSLTVALADAVNLRDARAAQALDQGQRVGEWLCLARDSLAARPDTLRFRTSGSTGTPKSCTHHLQDLLQEMHAMHDVLGPVQRIVSAVRSHHIYGFLFTVLLPHAMGQPDLPVLDLQGQSPVALGAQLQPGDLVIGFPDWWRAVARMHPEWPEGVIGITSTAPCPDEVCQAVMASGLKRLLHIYGSSETAGIGWRDWPEPGYRLHDHWQRVASQPQQLQRVGPSPDEGRITLQDHIEWLDERHFRPGARVDGAVQVGGVNVHLDQVAQRLCQHPGVEQATVRLHSGGPSPRLKAFIVPRRFPEMGTLGPEQLIAELTRWAQRHLAPAARPVHYTVGESLPRNAMGKACDWPL